MMGPGSPRGPRLVSTPFSPVSRTWCHDDQPFDCVVKVGRKEGKETKTCWLVGWLVGWLGSPYTGQTKVGLLELQTHYRPSAQNPTLRDLGRSFVTPRDAFAVNV